MRTLSWSSKLEPKDQHRSSFHLVHSPYFSSLHVLMVEKGEAGLLDNNSCIRLNETEGDSGMFVGKHAKLDCLGGMHAWGLVG